MSFFPAQILWNTYNEKRNRKKMYDRFDFDDFCEFAFAATRAGDLLAKAYGEKDCPDCGEHLYFGYSLAGQWEYVNEKYEPHHRCLDPFAIAKLGEAAWQSKTG